MRKLLWKSLSNSSQFKKITRTGKKISTPFFIFFNVKSDKFKLGVVASRKVGCAVERNRAKRLLRQAFSEVYKTSNSTTVLIAKSEILKAKYSEIKALLEKTVDKPGIKYNFD